MQQNRKSEGQDITKDSAISIREHCLFFTSCLIQDALRYFSYFIYPCPRCCLLAVQKFPQFIYPLGVITFFNVGNGQFVSSLLIQKGAEIFRLRDEGLIFPGDGISGESDTGNFDIALFIKLPQIWLNRVDADLRGK